ARAMADALAEVFVGPDASVHDLAVRYEMFALAPRYALLNAVIADHHALLAGVHTDVLQKSGRLADPVHVRCLIAVEDGAVMGALGQHPTEPINAAREALVSVVDVLAPPN
ncbi:MAG TPA: TetR/AcrR family transcriptional regulator, partial [Gordonia sp. (in: high G+C Gram-positive bacteria)]|nr:TetR/AcrR family transcriptional regulator [Gordonia sp. (in: high G+C Gram-positive bacteria)]